MRAELIRLNGGKKQLWLRTHRAEVEQFYFKNGPDATRAEFNLSEDTLKRFLERRSRDIRLNKLSESDRWVLRVAQEGIREVKQRVSKLEDWQAEVEPVIAVGRGIIATLAQVRSQSHKITKPVDSLSLTDFVGKLKK